MNIFEIIKNWFKKYSKYQLSVIDTLFGSEDQIRENIRVCHQQHAAWKRKDVVDDPADLRPFIGLYDRYGKKIRAGDKMRCKVESRGFDDPDELDGVIKWAKYKAGYTLQSKAEDGENIAAFRCVTGYGVANIKEMPDGRIDGIIIDIEQSHFTHARQIINKWPKWKQDIRCAPCQGGVIIDIERSK